MYLCIPTEQLGFSLQKAKNLLASSPIKGYNTLEF